MSMFKKCEFVMGAVALNDLPMHNEAEFAFAGRSNVGKSSLLNALTNRRNIARTSKTPGRTQQVNFFSLDNKAFIADLPGYGYAKASKSAIREWNRLIRKYLRGRVQLRRVFILIDARHGVKPNDIECMDMLDEAAVSYQLIYTKMDKLKAVEKPVMNLDFKKHQAIISEVIFTSSEKGDGIKELQQLIESITNT